MDGLLRDMRFAARALRRAPVVFVAGVLTLAIGTGLATGVFAVAYGALLRPLPYRDPGRLVLVVLNYPGIPGGDTGVPLEEVKEWQSRLRTFDQVAGQATGDFTIDGSGDPRVVRTAMVTDGFFEALRLPPVEGSTDTIHKGSESVAISAALARQLDTVANWRSRGLTLGSNDFGIAAVLPPRFTYPGDDVDVWVRAEDVPGVRVFGSADHRRFRLVGRLAPGVTIEQARDDARRVVKEIDDATASSGKRRDAAIVGLSDGLHEAARGTVVPFLAGAVLVLLIACANVSGLLAGRSAARQREWAVRRALGGGFRDLARCALAETVIIALLGWLLGLWIASLVVAAFVKLAAGAIHNLANVNLNLPVVVASLGMAVLVAILSGTAPALRATRVDPGGTLTRASDRATGGGRWFSGAMVVVQVALTVVLLVCAGLLMRTVMRLVAEDRGFDTRNGLAMRLMLTQTLRFDAAETAPFVNRLVGEVRRLPGVVAAGIGSDVPPKPVQVSMTIRLVSDRRDDTFNLSYASATPGFLEALGAQVVSGRLFEERDRTADPAVAIITQAAAKMMFPNREAVGLTWPAPLPGAPGQRVKPKIIGVVRDIRYGGLDQPAPAAIFACWEKLAPSNAQLLVRTSGSPDAVAGNLRHVVHDIDPSLPLFPVQTLDDVIAGSIADRRLRLQLAGAFAGLALAFAAVALWGAMAQSVIDRRREVAVRLAMGASQQGAVRLVLRNGLVLSGTGLVAGMAGGGVAARMLRHLLHGITAADPVTFGAAGGLALAVSLLACYVPARRAAAVSPADLLRE